MPVDRPMNQGSLQSVSGMDCSRELVFSYHNMFARPARIFALCFAEIKRNWSLDILLGL